MNEISDRLVLLLMAATGLAVGIGWTAGFVEAEIPGLAENVWLVALAVLFVLILVGVWWGFDAIDVR